MGFAELGLSSEIVAAVEASGYAEPTPIQERAIPVALEGRDIFGIAQTGTGKTASFVLPIIQKLAVGRARARMPRSLILEPTRELAAQVATSFESYGRNHKLTMALLIGGVSFTDQDKKLDRGVDVLIATPGRLLDHCERGKVMLNGVQFLVIDEADRMLDMGFIPDVEDICRRISFSRQTMLFSATMPQEIQELADRFMQPPVKIEVAPPSSPAETVQQWQVLSGGGRDKRDTLRQLLRDESVKNGIVFCNRKSDVAILCKSLQRHGFNAAALHGDMEQRHRMKTLDAFRNGEISLLIASDVAARGLDIPEVGHVFNFDVPIHAEDYVHRIGRTGRAGRSGCAFMLVTSPERKYVETIEELIGRTIERYAITRQSSETGESGQPSGTREARASKKSPGRRKRGDKPAVKQQSREPRASKETSTDKEPDVIGMGEHVPAFLQGK
ncbi:MAG: DEAD/DEAH box helicase [Hyphomicrobiales bacterium]|nr:DEAD/DEAH box helicase [Hyphomicrobiales bacterium]